MMSNDQNRTWTDEDSHGSDELGHQYLCDPGTPDFDFNTHDLDSQVSLLPDDDQRGNKSNSTFEHENFSQPDPDWRNLPVEIEGVVEAPIPGFESEPAEASITRKRTRPRDKNWTVEETIALLKSKEEGLEVVVVGKDWENISKRLEEGYGFIRSAKSCENRWGTLLKRHTDIQKDIQSKSLCPNTSGWGNYWNGQHKLLQVFSLECYETIDRIQGIKPRKKSGAGNKLKQPAVVDAANGGTSSTNPQLLAPFADPSSDLQAAPIAPLTESFDAEDESHGEQHETDDGRPDSLISEVRGVCEYLLKGRQHSTNEQDLKIKEDLIKLCRSKYDRDRSMLELEILKEKNKLQARRHRRPRKLHRKKNA